MSEEQTMLEEYQERKDSNQEAHILRLRENFAKSYSMCVGLRQENEKLTADLAYAHAILDDVIKQFNQVSIELATYRERLERMVKP